MRVGKEGFNLQEEELVHLVLDIRAVAKGRPRVTRSGHAFTPKTTADYEKLLAVMAREHLDYTIPYDGYVTVEIVFTFKTPKSWKKADKELVEEGRKYPERGDIDNYIKSCLDGIQGVVFTDDKKVIATSALKMYGESDQVEIIVNKLVDTNNS